MLRRHLRTLLRLSLVGAALTGSPLRADEPLDYWLGATSDPAVTSADFVTDDPRPHHVSPASLNLLDPRQIFEDIERESEDVAATGGGASALLTSAPLAIPTSALEGIGSSFNQGENQFIQATDPAQALQQSNTARGVNAQRRSALAFDPRVRSYGVGQLYTQANGTLMLPVRPDLSTILSATDPWLIQNIDVLKGPYGLRYGPGFAFLDVNTMPSPRYDTPETHLRSGYSYLANGKRHYARDTVYGGGTDYGFIAAVGYRNGAQYDAGGNTTPEIPGAYKNFNVMAQLGFDVSPDAQVELRYQHLDASNTVYPGQIFFLDGLTTDMYEASYVEEDAGNPWDRLYVGGWFYRTPVRGRVRNDNYFNTQERIEQSLSDGRVTNTGEFFFTFNGNTDGRLSSSGGKVITTYGETGDVQLNTGVDIRHLRQTLNEEYVVTLTDNGNVAATIHDELPDSQSTNPGAFAEYTLPVFDAWTTRIGGRVDYVYLTTADVRPDTLLPGGQNDLSRGDVLYSFYLMNDIELTSNWTASFGAGQAQRAPTLIQRYSDGMFLSVIQNGFSRIIGSQYLDPERVWQGDASLTADYEYTRGQVGAFYAVIDDYIGYLGSATPDPTGAQVLQYINIPQATLAGFEAYGEHDCTDSTTVFAAGQYVYGQDNDLHSPLLSIPPLDTRAGVRWHDSEQGRFWNLELAGRFVAPQDRLGIIRVTDGVTFGTAPLESRTPGFYTVDLRGFWTPRGDDTLTITGGIVNLTDTRYIEHLDIRLPQDGRFGPAFAYAPGFTPYVGVEWTF